MATIMMRCHCGTEYPAKTADLKRGWAMSCNKACAAKRREFKLPKAKPVNGEKIKQNKRPPSSYRPNDLRNRFDDDWEPIQ